MNFQNKKINPIFKLKKTLFINNNKTKLKNKRFT